MWRLAGATLETPAPAVDTPAPQDRLTELRTMAYPLYLRTPEWRQTRAAALERAANCCSLDITHTEGLEVHHRTYERLGEELATDLAVLCRACHRLHHREHGRPGRKPAPAPPEARVSAGPPPSAHPVVEAPERRRPSVLRRLLGG